MSKATFKIVYKNSKLILFNAEGETLYKSIWFMDFGKSVSEVFDNQNKKLFTITKQFQFWKWRMVFKIVNNKRTNLLLFSKNIKNTVYQLSYKSDNYTILIHYKKRISILKNTEKIAEFDAFLGGKDFLNAIHLVTNRINELSMLFALFSCLKIGESESTTPALRSQKQLEPNLDSWT